MVVVVVVMLVGKARIDERTNGHGKLSHWLFAWDDFRPSQVEESVATCPSEKNARFPTTTEMTAVLIPTTIALLLETIHPQI